MVWMFEEGEEEEGRTVWRRTALGQNMEKEKKKKKERRKRTKEEDGLQELESQRLDFQVDATWKKCQLKPNHNMKTDPQRLDLQPKIESFRLEMLVKNII